MIRLPAPWIATGAVYFAKNSLLHRTKSSLINDFRNYKLPQKGTLKTNRFFFISDFWWWSVLDHFNFRSIMEQNSWRPQICCECVFVAFTHRRNDDICTDQVSLGRINSIGRYFNAIFQAKGSVSTRDAVVRPGTIRESCDQKNSATARDFLQYNIIYAL